MVHIIERFIYPFQNVHSLLIGIFAGLMSATVMNTGLGLTIAQNIIKGKKLPLYNELNAGDALTKGFWAFVVQLVYLIPAMIAFAVTIAGTVISLLNSFSGIATGGSIPDLTASLGLIIGGGVLFGILLIIGMLMGFMGVFFYLDTGNIKSAFNIGGIFRKMFSVPYLIALLTTAIYSLLTGGILALSYVAMVFMAYTLVLMPVGMALFFAVLGFLSYHGALFVIPLFAEVYKETS